MTKQKLAEVLTDITNICSFDGSDLKPILEDKLQLVARRLEEIPAEDRKRIGI